MSAKAGQYRELPGPRARRVLEGVRDYAIQLVQNERVVLDHGGFDGLYIYDVDRNEYLDFFSGAGVSNLGHNNKVVRNSVVDQVLSGAAQCDESVFVNQIANRLRVRLAEAAPGEAPKKVALYCGGGEANDKAVKILFENRPAAKYVLSCEGAFHGRTGYALALTTSKEVHHRGFPFAFGNPAIPFPDKPGALDPFFAKVGRSIAPEDIAGVFLELVQGEGGINVADAEEVRRLNAWCKRHEIPLVVDDVQAAFGRTGTLFSAEHYGIEPEVITLAKALGGGVQTISALIVRSDLDFRTKGRDASTGGGNMVACAAAHATLDVFEAHPECFATTVQLGELLHERLSALEERRFGSDKRAEIRVTGARGLGLFRGCDIEARSALDHYFEPGRVNSQVRDGVVDECHSRGLLVEGAGEAAIRFEPPLIVTEQQIEQAVTIFTEALEATVKRIV